jgi:hypothetical protein
MKTVFLPISIFFFSIEKKPTDKSYSEGRKKHVHFDFLYIAVTHSVISHFFRSVTLMHVVHKRDKTAIFPHP